MGLLAPAGKSKDEVNYRHNEKCLTCMHFYGPNSCELVQGSVSPEAVCNLWEMKPKDEGKDAQFYMDSFKKANDG